MCVDCEQRRARRLLHVPPAFKLPLAMWGDVESEIFSDLYDSRSQPGLDKGVETRLGLPGGTEGGNLALSHWLLQPSRTDH